MLSFDQKTELREKGVLFLPGLLPPDAYVPAQEAVRAKLAKQGIWDGSGWRLDATECPAWPGAGPLGKSLKKLKATQALITVEFCALMNDLLGCEELGRSFETFMGYPQILFSLPHGIDWFLPHSIWHVDMPGIGGIDEPGYQLFTFLEPVDAGEGGTLVAAGSHHFANPREGIRKSKNIKRILKRYEPFQRLLAKGAPDRMELLETGADMAAVHVQVRELTGKPGDVWLMDMRSLHTIAPNSGSTPRIMVTERFVQPEAFDRMMAMYRGEDPRRDADETGTCSD